MRDELTTGHGPLCSTAWGETCDEMPGCPGTTHDAAACWVCTPPPPPRCTCPYRLHVTQPPYQVNRTTVRRRTVVLGSYFTIDPFCQHHGDVATERHVSVPADEVLDEWERRGY